MERFSFSGGSRSTGNLLAPTHRRDYPATADAYELIEECGRGVSATVWKAMVKTTGEVVAIKILDMETMNCSLEEIIREASTMSQLNHPNLLPLLCSFVHKQDLWMVMPYVQGGSVLNIMRFRFPDGFDEPVIATIMKEVLKALEYLHRHGIIHRDIKAGNILVDNDGHVLLADFGVAATLERGGSWGNKMIARNTFVGTPCWMAPEVMEQSHGYDSRADIWSFGITLLELAHGHAPFARLPPMKVLLMTLQNPPPTLDQADKKNQFSKALRDLVAKCLVKDPSQRPTAAQLLEHKFFKSAVDAAFLHKHVLDGLPPVSERTSLMRAGHGPQSHQALDVVSQQEYRRGVSSWNFDVAALKAEVAAEEEQHRLASISEVSEVSTSEPIRAGESQDFDFAHGAQSPMKPGSPEGERVLGTPTGRAAAGGGKAHGRFKVYEAGEQPPPFSSPNDANGAVLMDDYAKSRSSTPGPIGSDEAEADKAKRKGRFRYVEEDFGADGKPRPAPPTKVGSQASMGERTSSQPAMVVPSVTVILPQLKDLLESVTLQHETMRELVAAVSDADRGKQGALNAFLSQHQQSIRPSKEEIDSLKAEIELLRLENDRLKQQLQQQSGESHHVAAERI